MRKIVTLLTIAFVLLFSKAWAQELTPTPTPDPQELEENLQQTQKEILEKSKEKSQKEQSLQAAKQKEQSARGSLNYFKNKLSLAQQNLQATIEALNAKIVALNQTIEALNTTNQKLQHQKDLLRSTLRTFYIESFVDETTLFLATDLFSSITKTFVYREKATDQYKKQIQQFNHQIQNLAAQKQELEAQKQELEQKKALLQQEVSSTRQTITQAQNEQKNLVRSLAGITSELSTLTAKEQEILRAKAAAALASTTVGNFEVTRAAIEKDAPSDGNLYFSFWTYGYPHRVGLNQYGAYGRAKAGQSAATILQAYYKGVEIKSYPAPATIKITENGKEREVSLEDEYLMGLGEMPSCWGKPEKGGFEALKAQVIAARSYALAYTNNGQSSICTTQKCQVYVGSASKLGGECGEYWKKAVEETRGQVLTFQGSPISAWYASTAGGFTLSAKEAWGKEVAYAQGIADLDSQFRPYDGPDYGNSPWYHKAWGNEPWLNTAQVEDLLNAALLPSGYNNLLLSPEKGGLSADEIRQKLSAEGIEPITNLTAIEVFGSNTKASTKLRAYYSGGATEIDAQHFRLVYNLRSPSTNAIWTSRFDVLTNQ